MSTTFRRHAIQEGLISLALVSITQVLKSMAQNMHLEATQLLDRLAFTKSHQELSLSSSSSIPLN
jgi:hypothetical protein